MNSPLPAANHVVLLKYDCLPFLLMDTSSTDVPAFLIHEYIKNGRSIHVCTINAEIGWSCLNDSGSLLLEEVDYWVPDGVGVSLMSRLIFGSPSGKIAGIDLAENLVSNSRTYGLKIALFGSRSPVLERASAYLQSKYPGTRVCAAIDGYSGLEGISEFKRLCRENGADIVFVACGYPLQDQLIADFKKDFTAVFVGVGGSFDVWSGFKRRAPRFVQILGLEWAYRIVQDPSPRRIKRSLALPLFVLECLRLRVIALAKASMS